MPSYHILSMDGGGIRGLLTIIIIQRLEAAHPGFLDQIDLFAGTSTGGILALGLAYGLSPERIRGLYETSGRRVFADTILDDVRDLGKLISPRYLSQLDADWGLAQWAPQLVGMMLEGGAGLADYQSRQILGERYMRVNSVLPVPIDLDGVEQIPLLQDIANQVDIQPTLDWLNVHF